MDSVFGQLVVVLALVFCSGFFAAAEIAIVSVRKSRVRSLQDEGNKSAEAVSKLHGQAERFLATVQIGITVISVLASAIGGAELAKPLAAALGAFLSPEHAQKVAFAGVVAFISYVSLIFGELVPKSLALRYSEKLALAFARPLLGLGRVARPVVWFMTATANVVLRPFKDRTHFGEGRVTPEEIKLLIGEAGESGSIEKRVAEIIERAVDFGELTVGDVLVPRSEIIAIDRRWKAEEIRRVLLEEGKTRMPVIDGNLDKVVGYVTAKDVVPLVFEKGLVVLEDIVRPPFFVPQTMRAVDLLRSLQKRREHLAIVVDEYGGTAGLCTMEDLVEEIVGEIFSEDSEEKDRIKREPDGSALVSAVLPVREFNRAFDADIPEDAGYDTLAGLLSHLAGAIPAAGQTLDSHGFRFTVVERNERRIKTVRVRPLPKDEKPKE